MSPTTEAVKGYSREECFSVPGLAVKLVCRGCLGNDSTCGMCKIHQLIRTLELHHTGKPIEEAAETAKFEADISLRLTNDKYDRKNKGM